MKKITAILFSCTLFVTACSSESPKNDQMILNLMNHSNVELSRVEAIVDDSIKGVTHADESAIQYGDEIVFDYNDQQDFRLEGIKTFTFILFDTNNRQIILEDREIKLEKGKEYQFELAGKSVETIEMKRK